MNSSLHQHGLKVISAPISLASLLDDVAALERALERTTGPVILTGHGYAGAVIAAAQEERVVSLVYIAALAHKASLDQTRILAAVQRPIALKCIQEKVPAPAWKTKPTWYLIAEEDRMMSSKTQRFMADRMRANIWSHNVDHTPMLTTPHFVVDVIMEAATQTLPR